ENIKRPELLKLREISTPALALDINVVFKVKIMSHHMASHGKLKIIQYEIFPKAGFTVDGLLCRCRIQRGEKWSGFSPRKQYTAQRIPFPFGRLHPKVLQDFIIISSQQLEFLLLLIFGIAKSIIIDRLLLHAELLTTVLNKLYFTTQFPFKLNEKVLQVLTNVFLYHDFSIQIYKRTSNISIPRHSVFCGVISQKPREYRLYQKINVKTFDAFPPLGEDFKQTKKPKSLLENLQVYHTNYFLVLRWLHEFVPSFPNLAAQQRKYRTSWSSFRALIQRPKRKKMPLWLKKTDFFHLQKSLMEMKESRANKKQS
ncbi:hypothetical protein HPG69_009380, partial [Diceros bicornis minor]